MSVYEQPRSINSGISNNINELRTFTVTTRQSFHTSILKWFMNNITLSYQVAILT